MLNGLNTVFQMAVVVLPVDEKTAGCSQIIGSLNE